jgi:hypothetical protein
MVSLEFHATIHSRRKKTKEKAKKQKERKSKRRDVKSRLKSESFLGFSSFLYVLSDSLSKDVF